MQQHFILLLIQLLIILVVYLQNLFTLNKIKEQKGQQNQRISFLKLITIQKNTHRVQQNMAKNNGTTIQAITPWNADQDNQQIWSMFPKIGNNKKKKCKNIQTNKQNLLQQDAKIINVNKLNSLSQYQALSYQSTKNNKNVASQLKQITQHTLNHINSHNNHKISKILLNQQKQQKNTFRRYNILQSNNQDNNWIKNIYYENLSNKTPSKQTKNQQQQHLNFIKKSTRIKYKQQLQKILRNSVTSLRSQSRQQDIIELTIKKPPINSQRKQYNCLDSSRPFINQQNHSHYHLSSNNKLQPNLNQFSTSQQSSNTNQHKQKAPAVSTTYNLYQLRQINAQNHYTYNLKNQYKPKQSDVHGMYLIEKLRAISKTCVSITKKGKQFLQNRLQPNVNINSKTNNNIKNPVKNNKNENYSINLRGKQHNNHNIDNKYCKYSDYHLTNRSNSNGENQTTNRKIGLIKNKNIIAKGNNQIDRDNSIIYPPGLERKLFTERGKKRNLLDGLNNSYQHVKTQISARQNYKDNNQSSFLLFKNNKNIPLLSIKKSIPGRKNSKNDQKNNSNNIKINQEVNISVLKPQKATPSNIQLNRSLNLRLYSKSNQKNQLQGNQPRIVTQQEVKQQKSLQQQICHKFNFPAPGQQQIKIKKKNIRKLRGYLMKKIKDSCVQAPINQQSI